MMVSPKIAVFGALSLTLILAACAKQRFVPTETRQLQQDGLEVFIQNGRWEQEEGVGNWVTIQQRRYITIDGRRYLCSPDISDEECQREMLRLYRDTIDVGDDA
jgi:hypothetical protein